jgi:hypothetical protein
MVAHIDSNLVLGIAAGAGAAFCYDGANVLQAREARAVAEPVLRASLFARLARRPRWVAASLLGIAGWPLQILALSVAPLTVVQPTLAIGLLLLLVVGSRMYDEHVTRGDLVATLAILAGVAGLALCAPAEHTKAGGHAAIAIVLAIVSLVALSPLAVRRRQPGGLLVIAAGAAYTVTAIATNLMAADISDDALLAALAWGIFIAAVAAVGLLNEMGAMQRMAVASVVVPIFVIQTAVPVALAPLVAGESWTHTPGGGAGIIAALVVCTAGAGWLGRSTAVDAVVAERVAQDASSSASTAPAADRLSP